MNSFTIGHVQSLPVSTTTDNQCTFSNTFTTLRARGLSQHPADTATLVVSIDSDGVIAVGGSLADSLPIATPTTLGVMYGFPSLPNDPNSSLSLGYNAIAAGQWSITIGNDILTSAEGPSQCNVAIGSYNLKNLTTGQFNTAVGQGSMVNLTMGSSNVAVGYEAGGGYESTNRFQTGSNNIAIGNFAGSGANDSAATNNIYIGPSTSTSVAGVSNSIMLGSGATLGVSNEFMINNISHFNIPALTTLADGSGTLLQYGGTNTDWVEALGGTYNSVEKIDNAISALQSSVSTTGPFVPTFTSEVNCTAATVNSGYSYYGEDFYNLYMLFTLDVTGSSISSFSVDISGITGEYNTDFTPTAIVSVSGGFSLYHSVAWSFSAGAATISLSFTSSTTNEGYYVPDGTYTVSLHSWGILTQQP